MKKIIIFVISAGILAGAGYYGSQYFLKKDQLAIADVLPQGALGYVQFSDLKNSLPEMTETPLWQSLKEVNYELLLGQGNLKSSDKLILDMIKDQLTNPTTNALMSKFFGQEFALAIYPSEVDLSNIEEKIRTSTSLFLEEMFSNIFLVTRVEPDVQIAEMIARSFNTYGADVTTVTKKYKEHVIHLVTLKKSPVNLAYVRIQDLLVIGVGERAAQTSVDVFKKEQESLGNDPNFQKVQKRYLVDSTTQAYWDIAAFFEQLEKKMDDIVRLSKQDRNVVQEQMKETFRSVAGFQSVGMSSSWGMLATFKFDIFFDKNYMSPEVASFYRACQSIDNKTIRFTPENVLGYQWGTCFDMKYYWEQMKKEVVRAQSSGQATFVDQIQNWENALGVSIENDILPAFGQETGGYFTDIQLGGFFPIPQLLFFIEVKDQGKAENLLKKLVSSQPYFVAQSESYSNKNIHYLAMPLGDMLQPSYTFIDDYLLIAINRKVLKSSIDAYSDKAASLAASPDFKEVNFGLTDKNTGVQFVRVDKIMSKLRGIMDWGNQWLSASDEKRKAFQAGQELRLDEAANKVQSKEQELKALQESIVNLKDNIWSLESQGLDPASSKVELETTLQEIEAKKVEIETALEQKSDLEGIVQGYKERTVGPDMRQRYLDEVIYPFMKGIESIKTIGAKSTMTDNAVESSMYIKM